MGTTAVAGAPHEIANVFGIPGVAALIEAAASLPFTFGVCASSCVPASPFESAGAEILAAGVESDHECTLLEEAEEKRRKGMWMFIRQGSSTKNIADLVPMVLRHGSRHVVLCTDDRVPDLILDHGHMSDCVRIAVEHGFHALGQLAPGFQADVLAFDEFAHMRPVTVWQRGRRVAEHGVIAPRAVPASSAPDWMLTSMHLGRRPAPAELTIDPPAGGRARVSGLVEGQVAVLDGKVIAEVPLPIGGLTSPMTAAEIAHETEIDEQAARNALGVTIEAPFMQLSFLGLSVIPHLRITDKGLVDVDAFALTDVAVSWAATDPEPLYQVVDTVAPWCSPSSSGSA